MVRRKSDAQVKVSDGAGGLIPAQDLRFDTGEWPVRLRVPSRRAQEWMAQLDAECELRGHASSGLAQLGADETSGTTQVRLANGPAAPTFDLVWERARDQRLVVRARPSGDPVPSIAELRSFLAAVTRALRSKRRQRRHRRTYLVTRGQPWSGDLWLTPDLCLSAPSKPVSYLNDPQIIVVDAMIEGIGSRGVTDEFRRVVRELLIFLDVVVGTHAVEQRDERVWTYEVENGQYRTFELRPSAYYELEPKMPIPGARPAMLAHPVTRPGIENELDLAQKSVRSAPQDAISLWQQIQSLPGPLRRQFLEAGNAFWIAQSFWPDHRTAFASFLVVSCEALKPARRRFEAANIYDVVNSLRDRASADAFRTLSVHPQEIRSGHFHRGRVVDEELAPRFGTNYFEDPSFDELLRSLHENCRICLIEWLRRDGNYKLQWLPRARPKWRIRLSKAFAALRGVR
jgi:hypothetical protein